MRALTQTLLPDPVAPAMSRWGIRARSTAYALPDTSRPSANVSLLVACSIRASSYSRRNPTTSEAWFGISMPTTSRPGMGASMRMERAARAIARSSARPSMRDSFTWTSGLTSYCVTTGPLLTPTTCAGTRKLRSFSSMMRVFAGWSTAPPLVGAAPLSRRSVPGSAHTLGGRVGATSARAVAPAPTFGLVAVVPVERRRSRSRGPRQRPRLRRRAGRSAPWRRCPGRRHRALRRSRRSGSGAPGWVWAPASRPAGVTRPPPARP